MWLIGVGAAVHAAACRGRALYLHVCGNTDITTTIVGAPQQCFGLHPSFTRYLPSRPRRPLPPPAALSKVVSSGEEGSSSRIMRTSTCSRRGRHEPRRSSRSPSHGSKRRDLAWEKSGDGGSPVSSRSSPDQQSATPDNLPPADTRTP